SDFPTQHTYTFTLPTPGTGFMLVNSAVGHPEFGCQVGPNNDGGFPCDQGQEGEEFNVLIDGTQVAFVPDHGEDQWMSFTYPLPALSAGTHTLVVQHGGDTSSINSVVYTI